MSRSSDEQLILKCRESVGMWPLSITIEVRLQIAALTVAEELNFTRAADRLKITQPALSKQIVELEATLGFQVFYRGRRVEITNAVQVFIRVAATNTRYSKKRFVLPRPRMMRFNL